MYGDFFVFERPDQPATRASKLPIGETGGRSEAWLQDMLFKHPEILPVADIDASFGPLLPLCCELRTEAGPIDIAYINPNGHLTLVECKLWRNPEARRKVVAQVLDYARAITRWSYSDLQRQVAVATRRQGNIPFEVARSAAPNLTEHHFADAVSRTMRSGRFLLLIAGDGIREDVGALAELINRNAASGFAFGLVEVALYQLGDGGLAVQPRVIARTQIIERHVVVVRDTAGALMVAPLSANEPEAPSLRKSAPQVSGDDQNPVVVAHRQWWRPVLDMSFDDPDQEPLTLHWRNNVRAALPWPGTWITAYREEAPTGRSGVFLAGRDEALRELWSRIELDLDEIVAELPEGTISGNVRSSGQVAILTGRDNRSFSGDDEQRQWLKETINRYVNALRPRIRRLLGPVG